MTSDKSCDFYKLEKEILTLQEKKLSYAEARRMVCKNNIYPGKCCARITKSALQQKKCSNVLIHRTPGDLPLFSQVSDGGQNFHGQDPTSTEEQIQPSQQRTSLETRQPQEQRKAGNSLETKT